MSSPPDLPLADSLRPPGPIRLEISQEEQTDRTVLHARGEVDVVTAPKLAAELGLVLQRRDRDVTVDLCDTTASTSCSTLLVA